MLIGLALFKKILTSGDTLGLTDWRFFRFLRYPSRGAREFKIWDGILGIKAA